MLVLTLRNGSRPMETHSEFLFIMVGDKIVKIATKTHKGGGIRVAIDCPNDVIIERGNSLIEAEHRYKARKKK